MADDPRTQLNALVGERWPFLRDRIVTDNAGGTLMALDGRRRPAALASQFARFERAHGHDDARGLASLWIQWYAVSVWPPLVAGILALHRAPVLDAARTALVVGDTGQPAGLCVPTGMRAVEPAHALESLARDQAAPLVDWLSSRSAAAPRVAWSNLGNVLGWTLAELGAVLDDTASAPGHALLRRRRWSDGAPNPLFTAAPCGQETGRPPRRVCCLRYRLRGVGFCSDCPVPPERRGMPAEA